MKQASDLGATEPLGRREFLRALPAGMCALASCRKPVVPHLFACSESDLRTIARRAAGREIDPDNIQRNSSGSQVYLIASDSRKERILVVPSGPPPTLLAPPPGWAIADDRTFAAWYDYKKASLEFRTGFHQEIPKFARIDFSPGSRYYSIANQENNRTSVYASENPGVPLASVNFTVRKIFGKNNRLYIFGHDGDSQTIKEMKGRVFRITGGALTVERDFRIPRPWAAESPFSPEDLDNWSDNLLCIDIRDEFGAKWFLYNLQSAVLTDIGSASTFGLFLQQDLIDSLASSRAANLG